MNAVFDLIFFKLTAMNDAACRVEYHFDRDSVVVKNYAYLTIRQLYLSDVVGSTITEEG